MRKRGAAAWGELHRLVYLAVLLGPVHVVTVQKVWEADALLYLVLTGGLLATRIKLPRRTTARA